MKIVQKVIMAGALVLALATNVFAQTNLRFTAIHATVENAPQLFWASKSNHIYQIQYADSLIDTNTGSITWNTLYDNYPSHGTNTFIGDFGNYSVVPAISHPKDMPTRFYQVVDKGTNTGENPTVTITAPTNGNVLSDLVTVSVSVSSSYPNITTKLYVDGQEMWPSADGTNYLINTCEWPNGAHTLFATARALSGFPGPSGHLGILVGRGVSSYVPVTFSNLISRITFSQPFFEPSLGQTQEVTATFAANCDWTLQIEGASSNVVRNVSGSGNSLLFDWDGTGDGETNIPDGVYHYHISAQTNGEADEIVGGGSGGSGGNLPPSPNFAFSDSRELWVVSANGSDAVPLSIYPPGSDTNNLTVVSASPSEINAARTSSSSARFRSTSGSFSPMDSGGSGYSGTSSQDNAAPKRPPTNPVKNAANSYGIAYWDYPDGRSLNIPGNGQPFPVTGVCHLDGDNDSSVDYDPLWDGGSTELSLAASLKANGWNEAFVKSDNNLSSQDMRRSDQSYGGRELFTSVTIGVFQSHGSHGTDPDYSAGSSGSKQIYFPSGNSGDNGVNTFDNGWLRLCQFGFGGSLKWMVINACFSLTDPNYGSMSSVGAIPLKTTHLLCGATTESLADARVFYEWGNNLLGIGTTNGPQSVVQAWFNAGRTAFANLPATDPPIIFRVVGYPECFGDTLVTNTAPSNPSSAPRNLINRDSQVFP